MDVVADLPADPQATEPVQMGKGAFHHPALSPEPGTVLGGAPGDDRLHTEVPDQAAVLVVVVTAVSEHCVRAASGPATLAAHGRNCLQ